MYKNNTSFQLTKKNKKAAPSLVGMAGLSERYDYDMVVYILRSLYRVIFKSKNCKENKKQLQRRIVKFEKDCLLPKFFSAMPLEQLLSELDDAQYYYPIRKREVTLPQFH